MRKILLSVSLVFMVSVVFAQPKGAPVSRPKLVVGIVVDQMRWDFLYRYYDRYSEAGFKRLINQGFSCENAFINYVPSYTAVGHCTVFTGSVPAISGITGNNWTDQLTGKQWYCTDDELVTTVGAPESEDGKMSPRNMLVNTITDELRMATNFKSQVIGVSLKDRASILPAGHLGKAYWFDDASGNFITSTYYEKELPSWVKKFNSKKKVEDYMSKNWNTLYSIKTYTQSDADDQAWEGSFPGETKPVFPHEMKKIYEKRKSSFRQTPFGNSITAELAREAVDANKMGRGDATDFLTINFASTDYVGHMYGPNSIEIEDTYLRLDKDLESLFAFFDKEVGAGNWTVFLTADHGAAHNIGFMKAHQLPADFFEQRKLTDSLNAFLAAKFGTSKLVRSLMNFQVNYNADLIENDKLDFEDIKSASVQYLRKQPGISFAVDMDEIGEAPIPEPLKKMAINGYNYKRSGAVQFFLDPGWFESYGATGTTHGSWNPYDTHIPLLWYGWGIKPGKLSKKVHMTDIAATLAALLHIQMPNGCVGSPIEEVMK
jgi:predicted AlkP superfamily pyrophosphatase or phosphodiesterase